MKTKNDITYFFRCQVIFAILTAVIGTLLHFVFDWSGHSQFVSYFAPVNESTWEHLKLLFFPALIFGIAEYWIIGRAYPSFITANTIGCISGLSFIVIFFYTYTGIIGTNYLWLDILTFFLGVMLCYSLGYYFTVHRPIGNQVSTIVCLCILILIACAFILFTNHWPNINLFKVLSTPPIKS